MGAYAYCQRCDRALDQPTAFEIGAGVQECRCGTERPVGTLEMSMLLSDFEERIAKLELALEIKDLLG